MAAFEDILSLKGPIKRPSLGLAFAKILSMRICYYFIIIPLLIACSIKPKTVQRDTEPTPQTLIEKPVDVSLPLHIVSTQQMQTENISTWTSSISLVCNAAKCPPQVGLLIFVTSENQMIYFSRCTASLIAPDKIITNAHCDQHASKEGYFITQKINGKHRQIKIKDLSFKQYKQEVPSEKKNSPGEIDLAIFTLEEEISAQEITPFDLPNQETPSFGTLYSYVVNEGKADNNFVIDEKICSPQRHEIFFPFNFSENPDTFLVLNCEIEAGNSGSPVLASRTSTTIEALVASHSSRKTTQKHYQDNYGRPPFLYEDYGYMEATNIRCANLNDGQPIIPSCTPTNHQEINRRFNEYVQSKFDLLKSRQLEDADRRSFKYEAYPYRLKNTLSPDDQYVIFHIPTCRIHAEEPESVPFIIEEVEFVYDSLARVEIKIIKNYEVQSQITYAYRNDVFGLKTPWPVFDGDFESPPASEQLGAEFDFSIPKCSH